MKIHATAILEHLNNYKLPFGASFGIYPLQYRFVNFLKDIVKNKVDARAFLSDQALFELATQLQEFMHKSGQNLDSRDTFGFLLTGLAGTIGLDVLAAAKDSRTVEEFNSRVCGVEATRAAAENLVNTLSATRRNTLVFLDNEHATCLSRIKQINYPLESKEIALRTQQYESEHATKGSGRMVVDWDDDWRYGYHESAPYEPQVPDEAARAEAVQRCHVIRSEIYSLKQELDLRTRPIQQQAEFLDQAYKRCPPETKQAAKPHQYLRFITRYREINSDCEKMKKFLQEIKIDPISVKGLAALEKAQKEFDAALSARSILRAPAPVFSSAAVVAVSLPPVPVSAKQEPARPRCPAIAVAAVVPTPTALAAVSGGVFQLEMAPVRSEALLSTGSIRLAC